MTQLQSSDATPNARLIYDHIVRDAYLYGEFKNARAMVKSMYNARAMDNQDFHATRRYFQEYTFIVSTAQKQIDQQGGKINDWQVLDLLQATVLLSQTITEE